MSATVSRDIEFDAPDPQQAMLPLASEGVVRWVWHGRFGPMLIEVDGERVLVNGALVEPYGSNRLHVSSIRT